MHCCQFANLTCSNNISHFTACDVDGSDVILVARPILEILIVLFFFRYSSEESLGIDLQVLDDSEGCGWKHDFVLVASKVKSRFELAATEPKNVLYLVNLVRFVWIALGILGYFLIHESQESLVDFPVFASCPVHSYSSIYYDLILT